jgi:AraC-like DNA-binding protein
MIEENSFAAWQYTIRGRGCIDLNTGSHELLPGSLMILSNPGPHAYYLPADSDSWEFVFLTMIGREAIRITRMIEHHLGNILETGNLGETIALLYEILEKSFSGKINDPFTNSSYTYRICMSLLKEIGYLNQVQREQPFDGLKKYLKDNIRRDISVKEMAVFMGLSYTHFFRLFSREMGMSPSAYLEDLKLKTAMDHLIKERVSVKETAALCGFNDVNYFCRIFRKHFGISPGKFKEKEIISGEKQIMKNN